jgi:hypothetical protein
MRYRPETVLVVLVKTASENCVHATECGSNPVSGPRLPKTGIFQSLTRDYRQFLSEIVQIWSIETELKSTKAHVLRALL